MNGEYDYSDKDFIIGKLSEEIKKSSGGHKKLDNEFYECMMIYPGTDTIDHWLMMVNTDQEDPDVIACCGYAKDSNSIYSFIVDSRYRRQGNGEKFLKYAIKYFGANSLEVYETNYTAVRLYHRLGFKEISSTIVGGDKFITMKLEDK